MDMSAAWVMQEYGLGELVEGLKELFPQRQFSLEDILGRLLRGDLQGCFELLKVDLIDRMILEVSGLKGVLVSLLLIGILSTLLSNLADIFESRQIADISFYFAYLLMVILLLGSFEQAAETMTALTEQVALFMKLFLPTYFLVMGMAAGGVTAGIVYQMLLFLVYLVQTGISAFIVPAIYGYVFLNMVNGLWMEERMALLMEALKKGVKFLLKAVMTAVMGISVVQSMITPVIDSLKGEAVQRAVSAIPGLGNLAGGAAEMFVGSAVLIKNSVGSCMLLLLIVLCFVPLFRIFCIMALLKGAAALMGLSADKRMTACTDRMGEGCALLLQAAVTVLGLFTITIAIISYTTNRGF